MNPATLSPRNANQAALRRLRPFIDATYPKGRFVAIGDDRILADAESFDALQRELRRIGRKPGESLIVEVGEELPEYVAILQTVA